MVDQEMVLRYLAFQFMDYEKSKKNIATFLDEMIEKMEKSTQEEMEEYSRSFRLAIKRCWMIFDDTAFEKRLNGQAQRRKRKNSTLFEVWTNALVTLSDEEMAKLHASKDLLVQNHLDMMNNDNDYFRSITYSTQKKDHFRIRRKKVAELIREVIDA